MSAVKLYVICDKPLDDDRRRRSDAVTCSKRCRTALWRARRRISGDGGVPFVSVTRDGYGTLTRFDPPASPSESLLRRSHADDRFYSQLSHYEETRRPLTAEDRAIRDHIRRNPGVAHPVLVARWVESERERQRLEDAERERSQPLKVQDRFTNPDPGVIGRRGMASRQANRHLTGDPYIGRPYTGPTSGPPRYPSAIEAEMIDAPWGRSTPRSAIGW